MKSTSSREIVWKKSQLRCVFQFINFGQPYTRGRSDVHPAWMRKHVDGHEWHTSAVSATTLDRRGHLYRPTCTCLLLWGYSGRPAETPSSRLQMLTSNGPVWRRADWCTITFRAVPSSRADRCFWARVFILKVVTSRPPADVFVRQHFYEFYCVLLYIMYCMFFSFFFYSVCLYVCMSLVYAYGPCCLI